MKQLNTKFIILGFLIICSSTNAQIIYTDINPDCESTMTISPNSGSGLCPIDFGNNGTVEYSFRWDNWSSDWFMHMTFGTNCQMALTGLWSDFIKPLLLNDPINNTLNWGSGFPEPFIGENLSPNFLNLGDRYVGVKFNMGANTHFGWVLVNFQTVGNTRKIIVKSYAYNSSPNTQILAGQTNLLSASSHEFDNKQVRIYPNPVSEAIHIDGLDGNKYRVTILNGMGQIMLDNELDTNVINLKNLSNGVYFINIISSNGMTLSNKIIKQ